MMCRSMVLRVIIILFSAILWSVGATEEFRTFEAQGRVVEARAINVDFQRGTVELELRNGQNKKVKPSLFSAADQEYIRDFGTIQEFKSRRLKVELTKKTRDKRREMLGSQKAIRRDTEVLCYEIKISNQTYASFEGLEIKYNIFYEQEELGRGDNVLTKPHLYGSLNLGTIAVRANVVKITKNYEIYNQRLAGGYDEYSGGSPTNQSGKSKGIWIKIFLKTPSGLVAVKEVALPLTTSTQHQWKSS